MTKDEKNILIFYIQQDILIVMLIPEIKKVNFINTWIVLKKC